MVWTPQPQNAFEDKTEECSFRELATEWFEDREHNPAIGPATIKNDLWALSRYLAPFFGDMLRSRSRRRRSRRTGAGFTTRTQRSGLRPKPASR